ncbi:hypothetical protein AAZX31_11G213600 [Glycine max]|nr:hypothetical protein GLYMA_11G205800v4 [Glycine max]KAH1160077.1 hypothetical protein GYH30_031724 [Glycine max]
MKLLSPIGMHWRSFSSPIRLADLVVFTQLCLLHSGKEKKWVIFKGEEHLTYISRIYFTLAIIQLLNLYVYYYILIQGWIRLFYMLNLFKKIYNFLSYFPFLN